VTNDRTIGALRMHIEVRAGDVVDLGRIEIGTGSARFLVTHGDGSPVRDAFVAIAAGERSPFVQWPKQTRENGVELTDVPQHSFDVLVWGADIAPVRAALVAAIGECATVPIVAARGTPVTVQWSDAK